MSELFVQNFFARWADMDFNQHMRNAAFLGCAEDTRMRYLESRGWTMREFMQRQIGPVVLEDKLTYKKEIRLLQGFSVNLKLSAATPAANRMKLHSEFMRDADGVLCAVVESVVLWFSLVDRKPIVPPDELRDIWMTLPRTDDFETW